MRRGFSLRLITDDVHLDNADQGRFWEVLSDVEISSDGNWVTWTMLDQLPQINFYPTAVPAAGGDFDIDGDIDVFVAAVDDDFDGFFFTGDAGPYQVASVTSAAANLPLNSLQPTISGDGRFIAFAHSGPVLGPGTPPRRPRPRPRSPR